MLRVGTIAFCDFVDGCIQIKVAMVSRESANRMRMRSVFVKEMQWVRWGIEDSRQLGKSSRCDEEFLRLGESQRLGGYDADGRMANVENFTGQFQWHKWY